MRAAIALLLLLLAAPALHAEDTRPADPATPAVVEAPARADAPEAPAPHLDPVQVQARFVTEEGETAVQDMPNRGSFWWYVGIIVVAGIVLALLLD